MVRLVHVNVPLDEGDRVALALQRCQHVHGLAEFRGQSSMLLAFKSTEKHLQGTMNELEAIGVGLNFGTIDILGLVTTKPAIVRNRGASSAKGRRRYRFADRMSVEEIQAFVDGQSHLTFDFVACLCMAAMLAAIGLVTDSSVTIVASMLLSPLMGPILCLTFGMAASTPKMTMRGIRNEIYGVFITFIVGCIAGLSVAPFFGPDTDWGPLRSDEIDLRSNEWGLLQGFLIAVPSGLGVALAITGGGINALVGVAISASLLPPTTCAGITFMNGLWNLFNGHADEASHFFAVMGYSWLIYLINLVTITAGGFFMFRVKKIRKVRTKTSLWDRRERFSETIRGANLLNRILQKGASSRADAAAPTLQLDGHGDNDNDYSRSLISHNGAWGDTINYDDDSSDEDSEEEMFAGAGSGGYYHVGSEESAGDGAGLRDEAPLRDSSSFCSTSSHSGGVKMADMATRHDLLDNV